MLSRSTRALCTGAPPPVRGVDPAELSGVCRAFYPAHLRVESLEVVRTYDAPLWRFAGLKRARLGGDERVADYGLADWFVVFDASAEMGVTIQADITWDDASGSWLIDR